MVFSEISVTSHLLIEIPYSQSETVFALNKNVLHLKLLDIDIQLINWHPTAEKIPEGKPLLRHRSTLINELLLAVTILLVDPNIPENAFLSIELFSIVHLASSSNRIPFYLITNIKNTIIKNYICRRSN